MDLSNKGKGGGQPPVRNQNIFFYRALKMQNVLDEEKIECALRNKEIWFLVGLESENVVYFIYDVGIHGITCL